MKIPGYKRIYYTDFPSDAQKTVEQLSYTVNNSFSDLYSVVQNGISFRDNVNASINDVTVTVDSTGTPTSTATFNIANSNTIDGTQVIRAVSNGNNNIFPTSAPFITYAQNGSKITVINVAGLPAGTPFTLRVISYLT